MLSLSFNIFSLDSTYNRKVSFMQFILKDSEDLGVVEDLICVFVFYILTLTRGATEQRRQMEVNPFNPWQ